MDDKKLTSRFVALVMPNASEKEIEEATQNWFMFLETLYDIVRNSRCRDDDSQNDEATDMLIT